jgi:hypothetical protein
MTLPPNPLEEVEIDISIDLMWLRESKPLMRSDSTKAESVPLQSLSSDTPPSDLRHYPAPPRFRLGRVFEDVMCKAIELSDQYELALRNYKIMQNKITLGEMDFLVRDKYDKQSLVKQWELAIKFYLFRPHFETRQPLERFLGPGGQDRLDKKWFRLIDHQLGMSQREEAAQQLSAEGYQLTNDPAYWLTGILFYPLGFAPENAFELEPTLKELINPDHKKGIWLHRHQCHTLGKYCEYEDRFWIIQKHHWIAGFKHFDEDKASLLTPHELHHALAHQSHAAQVAWVRHDGTQYQEISRLMVVSDDWPVGAPARPERAEWATRP